MDMGLGHENDNKSHSYGNCGHEQKQPILMVEWHRELQLTRDGKQRIRQLLVFRI